MRMALDQQKAFAETLLTRLAPTVGDELVAALLDAPQKTEAEINAQRERVKVLREKLAGNESLRCRATCWPLPMRWCARACGSWAATDGRSTSASADWITCWARART